MLTGINLVRTEQFIFAKLFTPLFAMARVSGWLAHWLEQLRENKLFRPDQIYSGEHGRSYVPIEQRQPPGCSKWPSSKAEGESKPEAYPQGYVEDFDEPRTMLADFFSILLKESSRYGGKYRYPSQGKSCVSADP